MKYKHVQSVTGLNLLFWRLDLVYFREKKNLSFDDLAGPVRKMAIPQNGPQNKLTKLYNYGHKISKRFTQADYSNNKAHTLTIKLAIYSDICWLLSFSSTSLVLIIVISLGNLHKRPKALACYYLSSHWVSEWVKKSRWKTIESPPPLFWVKSCSFLTWYGE